jgi:hypothetical protein
MDFAKKPVKSTYTKSLTFDEENGVVIARIEWAPPAQMGLGLDYRLTRDEAKKLAASIMRWVNAK